MCGIAGIIVDQNSDKKFDSCIKKMTQKIYHRGPDDEGFAMIDNIYFGHRRLSILELSKNGSQPMISSSSNTVIVFNGEIYNHLNLRNLLKNKISWKGSSDTETILELIDEFGLHSAINYFEGMFSIAVYDKLNKKIYVARDRAGEKPLYYSFFLNNFYFSSELKSFEEIDYYKFEIDDISVNYFFKYNYIPSPKSIYKNVKKLEPNSILEFDIDKPINEENSIVSKYGHIDISQVNHSLEESISNAVKKQLISDVPIGSFLSGGIDSSLVSVLMQKHSSKPINTFTIGFKDQIYDESKYAKKIANTIKSNHHEFMLDQKEILKSIKNISKVYDEPFADNSQLPTMLLSRKSSKLVKVCLTGDGGDELFCGYHRYFISKNLNWIFKIPYKFRLELSKFILNLDRKSLDFFFNLMPFISKQLINPSDKTFKFAQKVLPAKNKFEFYDNMISVGFNNKILNKSVFNQISYLEDLSSLFLNNLESSDLKNFMTFDYKTYLPDDLLVKVDRAAMNSSLETRCPLLDPNVVKKSRSLDDNDLFKKRDGKIFLKNMLSKLIDPKLFDRPKQGFGIPLRSFLNNELKEWSSKYLSKKVCSKYGFVNFNYLEKIISENQKSLDRSNEIWQVIIFHQWLEERS